MPASQAGRRGFDPRLPLFSFNHLEGRLKSYTAFIPRLVHTCLYGWFSTPAICSVRGCALRFQRICAISSGDSPVTRPVKTTCGVSLAGRLHMSSLRAQAGLSDAETSTVAMRRLSVPGLVDGRHNSPQHKNPTDRMVLGDLSDVNGALGVLFQKHPRGCSRSLAVAWRGGIRLGSADRSPAWGSRQAQRAKGRHCAGCR